MAQAAGVMGLQGLQGLYSGKHFAVWPDSGEKFLHLQERASSWRRLSVPPICAIAAASSEDSTAVKKKTPFPASKVGQRVLRDQQIVRALTLLHENISTAAPRSFSFLEDEFYRLSLGRDSCDSGSAASTILERSILEAQWAWSFEEMENEANVETVVKRKVRRKSKSKGQKEEEEQGRELEASLASTSTVRKPLGNETKEEEEQREQKAALESTSNAEVVKSGNPSARVRRLQARKKRVAAGGKPTPPEVLMLRPMKKYEKGEKVRHAKPEGVQDYLTTYLRDITKIDLLTKDEEVVLSKKLRIGLNLIDGRKQLAAQLGYEPTKEQWAPYLQLTVGELVRKLGEAEFARDKMVMANLRLVVSVAKRYNTYGLEMADLIQEGSIGLLRGVEKFDHTRGYKLSTYVHWWIRQGVTRAIADHSRTVRVPVHMHDTLGRIRKAKSRLLSEGSTASVQELSEATSLSGTKVKNALKVTKRLVSLDMEVGRNSLQSGDGETRHSLVADRDPEYQPWNVVERMLMKEDVDKLLTLHLNPRERDIVRLHYGVGRQDGFPMSLESISYRYGVSRERVRQLETAAMRKLQITSREQGLERYCHSQ